MTSIINQSEKRLFMIELEAANIWQSYILSAIIKPKSSFDCSHQYNQSIRKAIIYDRIGSSKYLAKLYFISYYKA